MKPFLLGALGGILAALAVAGFFVLRGEGFADRALRARKGGL